MTIAEQIDSYLKQQLQKIAVGATITMLGGAVYTFRTAAGALVDSQMEYTEHPDVMPSIVIYSGKNSSTLEDAELGMENHLQEISIEGFIESDKAGTEGDYLKSDIAAAIKADPWFAGLITELQNMETDAAVQIGD